MPTKSENSTQSVAGSTQPQSSTPEIERKVDVIYKLVWSHCSNPSIRFPEECKILDNRVHITGPHNFSEDSDEDDVEGSPLFGDEEVNLQILRPWQKKSVQNHFNTQIPCEFHLGYGPFSINFRCKYDLTSDTYRDLTHISGFIDWDDGKVVSIRAGDLGGMSLGIPMREFYETKVLWVRMDGTYEEERGTFDLLFKKSVEGEEPVISEAEMKGLEAKPGLDLSTGCLIQPITEASS